MGSPISGNPKTSWIPLVFFVFGSNHHCWWHWWVVKHPVFQFFRIKICIVLFIPFWWFDKWFYQYIISYNMLHISHCWDIINQNTGFSHIWNPITYRVFFAKPHIPMRNFLFLWRKSAILRQTHPYHPWWVIDIPYDTPCRMPFVGHSPCLAIIKSLGGKSNSRAMEQCLLEAFRIWWFPTKSNIISIKN